MSLSDEQEQSDLVDEGVSALWTELEDNKMMENVFSLHNCSLSEGDKITVVVYCLSVHSSNPTCLSAKSK